MSETTQVEIPAHLAERILDIGPVEWGCTAEKSDEEHLDDFKRTLVLTREHFELDGPRRLEGVYVAGGEIVLAHTGTSPNSGAHASIFVGLWNKLHADLVSGAVTVPPTPPTQEHSNE